MFYANWCEGLFNNRGRYLALAKLLDHEDAFSLKTLDAIVGFRISLEVTILESVIEKKKSQDLASFEPDGTYINGGRSTAIRLGGTWSRRKHVSPES